MRYCRLKAFEEVELDAGSRMEDGCFACGVGPEFQGGELDQSSHSVGFAAAAFGLDSEVSLLLY